MSSSQFNNVPLTSQVPQSPESKAQQTQQKPFAGTAPITSQITSQYPESHDQTQHAQQKPFGATAPTESHDQKTPSSFGTGHTAKNMSPAQHSDIPITSSQPHTGFKAQQSPFGTGQTNSKVQQSPFGAGQTDNNVPSTHSIPVTSQSPHHEFKTQQSPSIGTGQTDVRDTAKQYLPESVASYIPGSESNQHHSDQSQPNQQNIAHPQPHRAVREHKEHKGPTGGVGSLPGTPNEEGVARLPDERAQEKANQSHEEKQHAVRSDVTPTLPSQEGTDDALGKTKGAGALPGSKDEEGVAMLPEERRNISEKEIVTAPSPRSDQHHGTAKHAVQDKNMTPAFSQPAEHPSKPETRTTESRGYPPTSGAPRIVPPVPSFIPAGSKEEKREAPVIGTTDASSRGASQPTTTGTSAHGSHSRSTGAQGAAPSASSGHGAAPAAAPPGHHEEKHYKTGQQHQGHTHHEQGPHKASLTDKIKGEAKVLQGKLTKNEDDILEGQRLKGKI